jgi:hypothetical protein
MMQRKLKKKLSGKAKKAKTGFMIGPNSNFFCGAFFWTVGKTDLI